MRWSPAVAGQGCPGVPDAPVPRPRVPVGVVLLKGALAAPIGQSLRVQVKELAVLVAVRLAPLPVKPA